MQLEKKFPETGTVYDYSLDMRKFFAKPNEDDEEEKKFEVCLNLIKFLKLK